MCLQASDHLLAAAARMGMEEVWNTFVVSCSPEVMLELDLKEEGDQLLHSKHLG